MKRADVTPDKLDIVSAIWILASNDENPLISYKGLVYRLGLNDETEARAIIASRPELFRKGATIQRVEAWKSNMRSGKNLPAWLKDKSDEERNAVIDGLGPNDVFRSQFRAQANSERSPIEIIKWGLEHLDRLRKARAEAQDAVAKKWQMWLVFWVGVIGVIAQFLIAFFVKK